MAVSGLHSCIVLNVSMLITKVGSSHTRRLIQLPFQKITIVAFGREAAFHCKHPGEPVCVGCRTSRASAVGQRNNKIVWQLHVETGLRPQALTASRHSEVTSAARAACSGSMASETLG